MRKVFFIISGFLFLLVLLPFLFFASRSGDSEPVIQLETHVSLSGSADSDGDGVPNWLEEITGSDVLNESSFPYNKGAALAKDITVDELLYGGPGGFSQEIVQRFLFDVDGTATITPEENERFIGESALYFLEQVEKRGLPEVGLEVDDTVSRQEVLNGFVLAMQNLADAKQPIDSLIADVFAKKTSSLYEAQRMHEVCNYTLAAIPRRVPQDVYDSYFLVLERVTYLCEALAVSLSANTTENFFYTFKLTSSGKLIEGLAVLSEEAYLGAFEGAITDVVTRLGV